MFTDRSFLPFVFGTFLALWLPVCIVWLVYRSKRCALVHLTDERAAEEIKRSKEFVAGRWGCGIYALRASILQRCETKVELLLATLIPWSRLAAIVAVPDPVVPLFRPIFPSGPYGAAKCLCGNYVARVDRITFAPPTCFGTRICVLSVVADLCMTVLALAIISAKLYVVLSV